MTGKLLLGSWIEEEIVPIDRLDRLDAVVSESQFVSVSIARQFGLTGFRGGVFVIAYLGLELVDFTPIPHVSGGG